MTTSHTSIFVGLGVFGLGVVLSGVIFVALEHAEQARIDDLLQRQVDNQFAEFRSGLHRYEDKLDSLRAGIAFAGPISRSQFRARAEELMARFPAVQQVGWIPLVAGTDRDRIEAEVRAEGFPDFVFRDLAGAGTAPLAPSQPAREYLPVIYAEPVTHARTALGFNVLSGLSAPQADRARTTGLTSLSQRVRLLTGSDNVLGFGLYLPVFRHSELSTGASREFTGLVLGLFRADEFLREAKRLPSSQGWFDLLVVDQTDRPRPALIGRVTAAGEVQFDPPSSSGPASRPGSIRRTAEFWGRTWEFSYVPHPGAPGLPKSQQSLGVLLVGIIASMAFGLLGYTRSDRTRKIEQEVIARTAELARAHELLQASSADRAQVFERIADAFVALDRNWRYTFVNTKAGAMLGRRPEDLIGKHLWTEFPERVGRPFHTASERAVAEQRPIFLEEHYEQADRWFEFRIYPSPEGVSIYSYDISERKRAEVQLREQAALLDRAQDAILVRDLEDRILYWNKSAERLYGWNATEAVGRIKSDLLRTDAASVEAAQRELMAKGEWTGELVHERKDGAALIVETRWTLMRDAEGTPRTVLDINTDVTHRKTLEAQFLRAQRMEGIGTLAGGIAHDLNNVLSPIMMSIGLLQTKTHDKESLDVLATIAASAKRGAEMVSQVLSFARGLEGRRVEVQARQIMDDVAKIARETFPKNIRIDTKFDPKLATLAADPTQLHQVLLNLCVNARDAMPQGGQISLSAKNVTVDAHYAAMNIEAKVGSYIKIDVEDNGTGIPQEIIGKIFDPFFTTKEIGKGTGLGLSTSLAIVKSHGGFIQVHSKPGTGTRFSINLPAQAAAGARAEVVQENEVLRGNGETVLVIDDEASIREITKQTLEAFGYRPLLASDGAEGLVQFVSRRSEISVVLTDMMMPVMDGPATIQALLRIDPNIRIIAASGITANGDVAKAANAGIKDFLPKPYTAETLLRALAKALQAR